MLHLCPACRRSFDEPGFCPFDRSPLVPQFAAGPATPKSDPVIPNSAGVTIPSPGVGAIDQQTLLSTAMPVAEPPTHVGGPPTAVDPKRTQPQGSGNAPSWTQDITKAKNRVAPAAPAVAADSAQLPIVSGVRAVSASEDVQGALAAFKAAKQTEYDRLVGETLDGRYYIEKKIGEGGMGVVFSARHAVIERPLAIKVLKRDVMRDTATIKRFVQEAKAASRIGHPNIVDVTDFGTTPDGMTYSVMEFVTGQTLGQTLRHSAPFPQERAIKIAVQIARALGAAHDKGIVHRDLKPENVFLVDRDGRPDFVKIVDFGIAKVAPLAGQNPNEPRITRAGSVFGTPEYMAPEQAAGKADTDGRVDVYALGVITYEMLTGKVPHRGDTTVRTLAMVMLDPIEPPSKIRPDLGIGPELDEVVMHALAKKREARFQTMGELIKALEGIRPPVGKSITGSPVYALAPLPPGATAPAVPPPMPVTDDAAARARPAVSLEEASRPVPDSAARPAVKRAPGDRPLGRERAEGKLAHEPEFVGRDKPATFEHVFIPEEPPLPKRRWPLALFFLLIVAGAAAAVIVVVKSRDRVTTTTSRDASPPPADATQVVIADDAAPPDAAVADAPDIIVVETPDAGLRPRPPRDAQIIVQVPDAGPAVPRRGIIITVITRPEGANLYHGTTYTGPGGVNIEQPLGTKMDLECRLSGYKPGRVHLEFDGKRQAELCVLERIKTCVKELKNPFDECEDPAPAP